MIKGFDNSGRRFLKFPAVHPCDSTSPATLLDSLITLSRSIISFQSKFFATHKRNVRETFRQIGILLLFFEELQDRRSNVSGSALLCFRELHVAFQKALFLFDDCTGEGARLLILMRSNFVTNQIRVLIQTIATALDVLPLSTIDVSREIRELVELVAKQSRKAKLELHPEDESAMKRVILILNQFENKFEPDRSFIKRVLDHLEIRSWRDCNREIKFLEDEISLDCVDGTERDMPLLSSLVAFMSYCRGVLFKTEDWDSEIPDEIESDGKMMLSCLNPEDFRCPISLEMMTDPVTVSTGQTYDRVSIQKWLKTGNLICPKTGEILSNTELVPNATLKKLIQQFCADNGISLAKSRNKNRDITRTIVAGSPTAAQAVKFLSHSVADDLYYGTDEVRNKASYEIRLLAKANIFNRACLVEAGTIPPLLKLLKSTTPSIQENAMAAILKLSKHSSGKKAIIENGGLEQIVKILKNGMKSETKQISAATIFYLSSVPEYRRLIGETAGAIPGLVELLNDGTSFGKKNALVAIFGLLLYQGNHKKVLEAGLVPLLVQTLASSSNREDLVVDSLAVLSTLSEREEGSVAILQTPALPKIINFMRSSTSRAGKENCVSILLGLCNNCGVDVVAVLAKEGSLMGLLYALVTDGTSQASKKARSLIKIMHKYHESSSSGLISSKGVRVDRQFIHVR